MVGDHKWFPAMFEVGRDGEIGDDEQKEDKKGADADCPGETNFRYEAHSHERKDDASERRTSNG